MLLRAYLTVLAFVMIGCGADNELEPAVLGEVCGVDGPFQLFALEPGQTVRGGLRPFMDRIYYTRAHAEDGYGDKAFSASVLWSTGSCGEEPRPLADDVVSTFVDERWPDVLLGCRKTDSAVDIVSIDPSGNQPPHVAFADLDCAERRRTAHGFVSVSLKGIISVRLHPYPDDPRSATVDPTAVTEPFFGPVLSVFLPAVRVLDDSVLALDNDGVLAHVALPGGESTVEQMGVRAFIVSPDGRYLLWQDLVQTNAADDVEAEGAVFLRDRTTGDGQALVHSSLAYESEPFEFLGHGIVLLRFSTDVGRVYSLPGLDFVDLPRRYHLEAVLDDGRWLLQRGYVGRLAVLDPLTMAEPTLLFGDADLLRIDSDGLVVVERPEDAPTPEGPVWYVPLDGSPPRRLADRAGQYHRLDGDRLITTVSPRDMLLIDLATGREQLIDSKVHDGNFWTPRYLGDDLVQYRVYDGDRTGVWLVRLLPAE